MSSPMTPSNTEVVQECFARFSERDVEGFLSLVHPDVDWSPANVVLESMEPYRGHPGVRQWFKDVTEKTRYLVKLTSPALDEGTQLLWPAVVTVETGEPANRPQGTLVWYLFEVVDGRVRRLQSFLEEDEARAAVGRAT